MSIERASDRGFNSAVILDDPIDVSCTSPGRVAQSSDLFLPVRYLSKPQSHPVKDQIEQQEAYLLGRNIYIYPFYK